MQVIRVQPVFDAHTLGITPLISAPKRRLTPAVALQSSVTFLVSWGTKIEREIEGQTQNIWQIIANTSTFVGPRKAGLRSASCFNVFHMINSHAFFDPFRKFTETLGGSFTCPVSFPLRLVPFSKLPLPRGPSTKNRFSGPQGSPASRCVDSVLASSWSEAG